MTVCKARFPRELVKETFVDAEGFLILKKHESMMNNYSPVMSYLLRSNTDVTSLMSSTSMKAAISYITDYITKSSMKTRLRFLNPYQSHVSTTSSHKCASMKSQNALYSKSHSNLPLDSRLASKGVIDLLSDLFTILIFCSQIWPRN